MFFLFAIFSFCELLCAPLHSLDRAYMADLGDDDKIMGQEEEIVLTRERPRDAVLRFAKPSTGEETSGNSFFPRSRIRIRLRGKDVVFRCFFLRFVDGAVGAEARRQVGLDGAAFAAGSLEEVVRALWWQWHSFVVVRERSHTVVGSTCVSCT